MKSKNNIWLSLLMTLGIIAGFVACDDPYDEGTPYISDNKSPIATYLSSKAEYSKWVEVLEHADMWNSLNNGSGAYTAFVPSNEAVDMYMQTLNIDSICNLDIEYAKALVEQHVHNDSLTKDDMLDLDWFTSLTGEKVYVAIDTLNAGQAILSNNQSTVNVTEMAIPASNGYIYELDGVLIPLVETLYDRIANDVNESSIFLKALDVTGWADSLQTSRDTVFVDGYRSILPRSYTVFSVCDKVFEDAGISSFDALVQLLGADDNYTEASNKLNEYIAYHILKGEYHFSDMLPSGVGSDTVKLWSPMAKDAVISAGYKYEESEDGSISVSYISLNSVNLINTQNGVGIHEEEAINGAFIASPIWMPIWEPTATALVWDLTDYYDVSMYVPSLEYQQVTASENKYYVSDASCYKVELSEQIASYETYAGLTYLTSKNSVAGGYLDLNLNDRLAINVGYLGSVEMQSPTIVKGKYKVELDYFYIHTIHKSLAKLQDGSNGGRIEFTMDSIHSVTRAPYTEVPGTASGVYTATIYDEIEFDKTASHLLKMVIRDPAASLYNKYTLHFDCIRFTPISEE